MKLHVIYRSTGSENSKARPPYYSKLLALRSVLQAAERCDSAVDFIFLNDGPIPADRLEPMEAAGEIIELPRVGMVGSYLAALELLRERSWPDADLAYLVEDDYLHLPHSLHSLVRAAELVPAASYFGLYALIEWSSAEFYEVDGQPWITADSTTSTFAGRVGDFRADWLMHRLGYVAGGSWDRDICHAYQGRRPYRWTTIIGDLAGYEPGTPRPWRRRAKRAIGQAGLDLLAIRRAFRRHLLIAPAAALAAHMTLPYMPPDIDWAAAAQAVVEALPT